MLFVHQVIGRTKHVFSKHNPIATAFKNEYAADDLDKNFPASISSMIVEHP